MITVNGLCKRFGDLVVLDEVSFAVPDGRLVVILGPSGTGKTVLLKSILGLLPVDRGSVVFEGMPVYGARAQDRQAMLKQVGYVFQGAALFDSMDVNENIALPLYEHTRSSHRAIREKVTDILEIIGLPGKGRLYPRSLSGGMKKLVAIGRALALDPKYLFYDEPTTGLDPIMRDRMVGLIADLKRRFQKSGIVVTHDLDTAEAVGDDILMLKKGRISKLSKIEKESYE